MPDAVAITVIDPDPVKVVSVAAPAPVKVVAVATLDPVQVVVSGQRGPAGADGATGATGATGPQGPQGDEGPAGADGADGAAGATGPTGPQGPQGDEGPQGAEGPEGPAGSDGNSGSDGSDGNDGSDGADGADGSDGQDGAGVATGGTAGQVLTKIDATDFNTQWTTLAGGGDALVANPLSQFAATTSAQLRGVLSDETGSGAAVFATSPTLVTPALGTPSALVGTNITGTAAGLTAGNVTTNANLTGDVTSSGSNATTIANSAVDIAHLSASGTASSSTFLRGDNTWETPAGGGGGGFDFVNVLTSDVSTTSTSFADVTGFTQAVTSGDVWLFWVEGRMETTGVSDHCELGVNGPTTTTLNGTSFQTGYSLTQTYVFPISSYDAAQGPTFGGNTTNPGFMMSVCADFSATGTFAVRFASEAGSNVKILTGSRFYGYQVS